MYCNQCGAQVPDHAKFCQACGSAVGAEPSSTAAENPCPENIAVTVKEKRPKRKLSPRLKKLLTILGGVAAVILAAVLIVSAVREHKRTTILGNIPDPESFFGLSGEHTDWDGLYEHNITFETDKVTKNMVDAYVELLGSDEYPFVLDETIPFNDGMVRYVFLYNGSEELYDAFFRQIMVEYSPHAVYPHTKVEISNSGNFELVPVEPYNSDNTSYENTEQAPTPESASEPQSEPEPEAQSSDPSVLPDFLSHDNSGEYQLLDESTPNKAIYQAKTIDAAYVAGAYVELLEEHGYSVVSKDITTYTTDSDKTFEWFLSHSSVDADDVVGDSPGQVRVKLNAYDSANNCVISVTFSEGITMENYSTGGSSSTDSTDSGYVDCPSCYGGNCTACNGRKGEYSYSPGLDREWEECWKCNGTGNCSRCGGDGQIFG